MDGKCQICTKQNAVMKRCTRCRLTFYCSRQCQVKDWSTHKLICCPNGPQNDQDNIPCDDSSTKGRDSEEPEKPSTESTRRVGIDFQKAFDTLKDTQLMTQGSPDCTKDLPQLTHTYLESNKMKSDVPCLVPGNPKYCITVRANKNKYSIELQTDWDSSDILKTIAAKTQVPLDKMKLIHKGKIVTASDILNVAKNKAVFQIIGEKCECEEGLDTTDIDLLMKQLRVERNEAVKALKEKGDILDAMLYLGNT